MIAGRIRQSFHFELVLKVPPEGGDRFVRFLAGAEASPRSRRKRTLLSFQRPALLGDVKKPPTRARGPGKLGTCDVSDCVLRALQCRGSETVLRRPIGQPGNDSRPQPIVNRMKWRFPACRTAPSASERARS